MNPDDINIEDMHLHIFNDNPEPKRESFDAYSRAARAYGEWNDGGSWELRGVIADDLAVEAAIEVYVDGGGDELARAAVIEAIVRKYGEDFFHELDAMAKWLGPPTQAGAAGE